MTILVFLFWGDILVAIIVKKGYFGNLFFVFDVVGTIGLMLDIPWFYPGSAKDAGGGMLGIARTGRMARAAANASRLARWVVFIGSRLLLGRLAVGVRLSHASSFMHA